MAHRATPEVEPVQLSMGRAAKVAGVSKSTLSRAIKSGKLSASRSEGGGWVIDPAELARVYEGCNPATLDNGVAEGAVAHRATPEAQPPQPGFHQGEAVLREQVAALQAQLDLMRERLDESREQANEAREQMRERADELRDERDEWREQAKAAQRMLADARAPRRWFGLRRA